MSKKHIYLISGVVATFICWLLYFEVLPWLLSCDNLWAIGAAWILWAIPVVLCASYLINIYFETKDREKKK